MIELANSLLFIGCFFLGVMAKGILDNDPAEKRKATEEDKQSRLTAAIKIRNYASELQHCHHGHYRQLKIVKSEELARYVLGRIK